MVSGIPEEFGENPPSSLFHLLSLEHKIHWQQNSPQHNTTSTMLDYGYGVLQVKGLAQVVQALSLSYDHRVFLQEVLSLSL